MLVENFIERLEQINGYEEFAKLKKGDKIFNNKSLSADWYCIFVSAEYTRDSVPILTYIDYKGDEHSQYIGNKCWYYYIEPKLVLKKGDTVWKRTSTGTKKTTIKTIGSKYITLDCDKREKFNRDNLQEVDGCGYADYIVIDVNSYEKRRTYVAMARNLNRFDFNTLNYSQLDEVAAVICKFKMKGSDDK